MFISEWYHRSQTLIFGLFLYNPSNLRQFKAQHRIFSSLMRYIIVPQWRAQLPELTFPQKSKVMGPQSLDPGCTP